MPNTTDNWEHIKTLVDGERFEINGMNIWNSEWKNTGERIQIKDPLYGKDYTFTVYEIMNEEASITFAAGEFSNCVWGIYVKK